MPIVPNKAVDYTWGRIYGLLSLLKPINPVEMDKIVLAPGKMFASALNQAEPWKNSEIEAAMEALVGALTPDDTKLELSIEQQSEFWLGYYHQRGVTRNAPKKAGPPLAEDRVDWTSVDWSLTNAELARLTGKAPQTVAGQRKRHGVDPSNVHSAKQLWDLHQAGLLDESDPDPTQAHSAQQAFGRNKGW